MKSLWTFLFILLGSISSAYAQSNAPAQGNPPIVNVTLWGATGNAVQLTNTPVTVASTTPTQVVIVNASFTQNDVNKSIFIGGIGSTGAGSGLSTTIVSVINPTTITIANAATTFISSVNEYVEYGTNDEPDIYKAEQYASSIGGTLYFPAGTYRLDIVKSGTLKILNNVAWKGDGIDKSIILADSSTLTGGDSIDNTTTNANTFSVLSHLSFTGLSFYGMRQGVVAGGTQLFRLGTVNGITIKNCKFAYSDYMGIIVSRSNHVRIMDNTILDTVGDGINVWDDTDTTVSDNTIKGANDDSISAHLDTSATAVPPRTNLLISDNNITESQGIHVIGAKGTIITGNVMHRIMTYGIIVGVSNISTAPQGQTDLFGVKITNNLIQDVFERQEPNPRNQSHDYILVESGPRNPGTGFTAAPGVPQTTSGTVNSLYGPDGQGYFYQNGVYTGGPIPNPGGYWVDVSGNTLIRTLPAVAAYSDWGYGSCLFVGDNGDPTTGCYNGPISEASLEPRSGIYIIGSLTDSRISDNIIDTTANMAIEFDQGYSWQNNDLDGLIVSNNIISDFITAGIWFNSTTYQRATFVNNTFDGDPHFTSNNRGSNGTWVYPSGANGIPIGIYVGSSLGINILRNTFRNVTIPINALINPTATDDLILDNIFEGYPVKMGCSTLNEGISCAFPENQQGHWIVEDSDPTSTTYGKAISPTLESSTTAPTTGYYVVGHWVSDSNYSASGTLPLGWKRVTTGSSNILGTDWIPIYPVTRAGPFALQTNPSVIGTMYAQTVQGQGGVSSITMSNINNGYVSSAPPTLTVASPDSLSGTTATAVVSTIGFYGIVTNSVLQGGTGYSANDLVTFGTGVCASPIVLKILTVDTSGVPLTVNSNSVVGNCPLSEMSVSNASVTGGTGTGLTLNLNDIKWRVLTVSVTNGGSGYGSNPTVTFSTGNPTAVATSTVNSLLNIGSNVVFSSLESYSSMNNLSTSGTNLATATQITSTFNTFTSCSSGAASLPSNAPVGAKIWVFVRCGSSMPLYPDSTSSQIESDGNGNSITLAPNSNNPFFHVSNTQWLQ